MLLINTEKFKRVIRRFPSFYECLRNTYYHIFYSAETLCLGSKIHEWRWKNKRITSDSAFIASMKHPHREGLLKKFKQYQPIETVLEVVCGSGQNLVMLAREFPNVSFYGIDINSSFIEAGKNWCAQSGIKNVSLQLGNADDLSMFTNRSVSITFTDATLIYIGPDKIEQALSEMKRITSKMLLFNEWHSDGPNHDQQSCWYYGHWVHNHRALIEKIFPSAQCHITKVPGNLWESGGGWEMYGSLVEVNLGKP